MDILSPEYLLQIELLQDRVPPFPTREALDVMSAGAGRGMPFILTCLPTQMVCYKPAPHPAGALGRHQSDLTQTFGSLHIYCLADFTSIVLGA